ncbi:MAG: NAD(P)/FAD-dependent oxidoreductase [Candidatus Nanoarchaeia archaeon]
MIAIIGAGPSGAHTAYNIVRHERVVIFEEHDRVGFPVQCTGITTGYLSSLVPIKKEFLVNKVSRVRVFSPDGNFVDFNLKNPNLVLDRAAFDSWMVGRAVDHGAELLKGHKFLRSKHYNGKIIMDFKGKYKHGIADALVGSDGPFSQVAKSNGMFGNRDFVVGVQARVSMNVDSSLVEFHLNKDFMGWVVPESDKVARVGIASHRNQNAFFKGFMSRRVGRAKVREYQSGFIPIFNPLLKTQRKNVYLVGDAATQVKATTYGGIIQGLMAAEELAKAYLKNLNYERLWKKRIGKDLWLGLMIRKKLNGFSNEHYNKLVRMTKKEDVKRLVEFYDRDFPSKLVLRLLLKEPKFLRFLI